MTPTLTVTPTATATPCNANTFLNQGFETGLGLFASSVATCVPGGCGWSAVTSDKPLITATMFGVTTPCVEASRKILEQRDYEVLEAPSVDEVKQSRRLKIIRLGACNKETAC